MSQSQLPSSLPLSNQNQQIYYPSESQIDAFRIRLSPLQALFLTKFLPKCYSLQIQPRSTKRLPSLTKIHSQQPRLQRETRKKIFKQEIQSTQPVVNKPQKAKSKRISQEIQNAVYQKYNGHKNYIKSSFEKVSQGLKPCIRILNLLKNSKTSWPFREPVDPIGLGIPLYTEIIKQPMDLSTIESSLKNNQYITPTQFHADVAKIITNSYTFNASNPQFKRITAQFEAYYRKIISDQSSDLPRAYIHQENAPEIYNSKSASLEIKKAKKESKNSQTIQSSEQVISIAEKKELEANIKKLPKEYIKGLLEIVSQDKGSLTREFDLKELGAQVIRNLQAYVEDKLSSQTKNKRNSVSRLSQESSFEVGGQSQS